MNGLDPWIVCVDAHYLARGAVAAAVGFYGFDAPGAAEEAAVAIAEVAPYEPGRFYLRELPCLRAALSALRHAPEVVIVDGYVWLGDGVPGLGAKLFDELDGVPVIGVAKTMFRGATGAVEVFRGASTKPLLVTAAGTDGEVAARHVQGMHGRHRIPTLLRRVDTLCRTVLA
jgi:deoxyribonuclease V